MAPADIAALRLELARALASAGRPADALAEVEAGLAESPPPAVRGELHRTAAEALERIGQPGGALAHWLRTAAAGAGAPEAVLAALRLLEDPASAADLARRVDAETLGQFDAAGTQRGAAFATRLLHLRLHRLRDESGGDEAAVDSLDVPDDAPAALLRVLAAECAALGLVEDARRLLPADDERSVALHVRLLVQSGLHAEALAVPVPDDAATARSVQVSHALAHLAEGRPGEAGDLLAPRSEDEDPEPHLARVVVALHAREYPDAEAAAARASSVAADSADVRLLRAQVPLERGEEPDVGRGRQLLERLVEPGRDHPVREPSWLRVQRAVRGGDPRFGFVRVQWALVSGDPRSAEDLLTSTRWDGLTPAQDVAVHAQLAELLRARGDTAAAAGALDRAAEAWVRLDEFDRAREAADDARRLDPGHGADVAASVRRRHAVALLDGDPGRDRARAMALAREAWELQQDEQSAVTLADACLRTGPGAPPAGLAEDVAQVLRNLAQVPVTPFTCAVRGNLLQRLAEVGRHRAGCGRAAAAWLLVANLLDPGWAPWLQDLVWALGAAGAPTAADLVARHQLSLAPEDPNALWVAVAARSNAEGAGPEIDALLARPEFDGAWTALVAACRVRATTLAGELGELAALVDGPADEDLPWMREVRADAVAALGRPGWRDELRAAAVDEESAGEFLPAARHHLLRGHVPASAALCARAEEVGEDAEAIDLVRRLGALVVDGPADGPGSAESALAAHVAGMRTRNDLLSLLHRDVPVLLRAVPPGSPGASALGRVRVLVERRLADLPAPAVAAREELEGADASGALAALLELLLADAQEPGDRVALRTSAGRARAALVRAGSGPWPDPGAGDRTGLLPTALTAVDAVLDRHASRHLGELHLLAGGPAGPETLREAAAWGGDLRDPGERRRALAVAVLDLVLREGAPLEAAAARVGFDRADGAADRLRPAGGEGAPEPLPARLAAAWAPHVSDAAGWWRLDDALAAVLPDHELAAARGPLMGRLAEVTTVREPEAPAGRGIQSALLGARLVPEDRSDEWVLLSEEIPALKQDVRGATGVDLPGFRLRFDPVLDDAITYLVHGAVAGFTRVPPSGWIGGGPGDDGGEDDAAVRTSARVVAESFREWALAHLPEFLVPQVLVDLLERGSPAPDGPAAALDDPARLVLALDEVRAALRARRRVEDGARIASVLRSAGDGTDGGGRPGPLDWSWLPERSGPGGAGHPGDVAARPAPAGRTS